MHDLGNLNPMKEWRVEIKENTKKRSNNANNLYWKWLSIIGDDLGYKPQELHESLKYKFLGTEKRTTIFGQEYEVVKSTTSLNTKEFSDYMERVQALALMYDLKLPQPDYYGLGQGDRVS